VNIEVACSPGLCRIVLDMEEAVYSQVNIVVVYSPVDVEVDVGFASGECPLVFVDNIK
jgi:hypothetical protein